MYGNKSIYLKKKSLDEQLKHNKKLQAWKRCRLTGYRMDYIRATTKKNKFTTLTRNLCRDFELNQAVRRTTKIFLKILQVKAKEQNGPW